MKLRSLKDISVVSVADGTKVGTVHDVQIDTESMRIVSLTLSGTGGPSVLPFASIRSIGQDAVMVESTAATQGATGQTVTGQVRSLQDLISLKVVNASGTLLGDVQDVDFGEQDGQVHELIARRGGMLGMGGTDVHVPASAIRGIGPKLVTVDLPSPPA